MLKKYIFRLIIISEKIEEEKKEKINMQGNILFAYSIFSTLGSKRSNIITYWKPYSNN